MKKLMKTNEHLILKHFWILSFMYFYYLLKFLINTDYIFYLTHEYFYTFFIKDFFVAGKH